MSGSSSPSTISSPQTVWPRDYYVCEVVHGLDAIKTKMDSDMAQYAAFAEVFPRVKYNKGQMASTRLILNRAGANIQQRFINYGKVSKGSWRSFKAKLPKTILDKFFSDDQAIRDLENDESTDSANDEEFNCEHH